MSVASLPLAVHPVIGRERDVEHLLMLLADQTIRLITLTGPGGVGKTRLAVEVAGRYSESAHCEARFISLAGLTDPVQVAPAIGQAFGLSNVDASALPESLNIAVADQSVLLIVDNFEHLVEAAPIFTRMLQTCRTLQVIVTSRILLRLTMETEYPVQPLAVAIEGLPDGEAVTAPSIGLFLQRSHVEWSALTELEQHAVIGICRRTDGLPLAIELAAARTRLLSLPELLARMDPALPMLTGGHRDVPRRLQTMQNAIAWSYELLTPEEQKFFSAVSVFSGGFTIDAAEAVAGSGTGSNTLSMLQTLRDQSLIRRDETTDGSQRFIMLETIREFGQERLAMEGCELTVRAEHAKWFARSLTQQSVDDGDVGMVGLRFLLPGDHDNLRLAMKWSLQNKDANTAATLAVRLTPFWWNQGYLSEAREAFAQIVPMVSDLPLPLRSSVLGTAAEFAFQQSDFSRSGELATEALKSARELRDEQRIRWHLRELAWSEMVDDPLAAIEPAEELVEISEQAGDFRSMVLALLVLAMSKVYADRLNEAFAHQDDADEIMKRLDNVDQSLETIRLQLRGSLALYSSQFDDAISLLTNALDRRREEGNRVCEMHCLRDVGRAYLATSDRRAAAEHFSQALELAYLLGSEHGKSYCYEEAAAAGSIDDESARLLGAAASIRNRTQLASIPTERALRESTSQRLIDSMGKDQFDRAFAEGGRLTGAEAYQTARRSLESALATSVRGATVLSKRETEVLRLIVQGKSDREIGEQLFVSHRTAATHVASILRKLSLHSRAEAAAWAVRHNLA